MVWELLHPGRDRDGAHGRRADQPGRSACATPASTSRSWRATASRSSSPRCSATASSTPTCTPATSRCRIAPRDLRPLHRARLRHRRHADRVRQGLPGAELHRLLPPRLQARRRAARRERLGAAGDARRRARRRDPRRLRAAVRPAAEGHLARPGAAAPVPDLAPLQRRDPAAAGAAAEDAAQRRRPRPRARPRARPVEHRQALPRALDERAGRLARPGRAAEERGAALRPPAAASCRACCTARCSRSAPAQQRALEALLVEQRRTNRLLSGHRLRRRSASSLGLVAMQVFLRARTDAGRRAPAGRRDLYCRVVFDPRSGAMPIYAYRCATCGHAQDVLQKISDPALTVCPACGAADVRQAGHGGRLPAQGLGLVRHRFPRRQATSARPPRATPTRRPTARPADGGAAAGDSGEATPPSRRRREERARAKAAPAPRAGRRARAAAPAPRPRPRAAREPRRVRRSTERA